MKKMDCKTANALDTNHLLVITGHKAHNNGKNCVWYYCPYREEKKPSFKVENNRFKDFATGQSGGVVDLFMLIWKTNVSETLAKLSNLKPDFSIPKHIKRDQPKEGIKVIEVKPIQSKPLYAYLWKRGIDPKIAKQYTKEVVFSWNGGKPQYALGFPTNKGLWELRNSIYQLSTGKDISFISNNDTNQTLTCFEGFFNYLSYLVLTKQNPTKDNNYLVLNSTVNLDKALNLFETHQSIELMLDNDPTGKKATEKVMKTFGNKVVDLSSIYYPYNDLNDYLTQGKN